MFVRPRRRDGPNTAGRPALTRRLYVSHFLSTWNSRSFEFGATLFLATAFPQSLLEVSVYAIARSAAAIFFSSAIGWYIDNKNRLSVVRASIVAQRASTALSCVLFFTLILHRQPLDQLRHLLLGLLCLLACVEKLSSVLNLVSVERDWVVVIAGQDEDLLRAVNAQMRRIDLFCKLVGPLAIALVDGVASTHIAVATTLVMNIVSMPVEYATIAWVYRSVPGLADRRGRRRSSTELQSSDPRECEVAEAQGPVSSDATTGDDYAPETTGLLRENADASLHSLKPVPSRHSALLGKSGRFLTSIVYQVLQQAHIYARSPAFLPSLSLSLLYLNALSFNGQTVTYLLSAGFTSWHVGLLRLVSIAFELSATWLGPLVAKRIGAVRAGIWFVNWELLCLALATAYFFPHSVEPAEGANLSGAASAANAIKARVSKGWPVMDDHELMRDAVPFPRSGLGSGVASRMPFASDPNLGWGSAPPAMVSRMSPARPTDAALVLVAGVIASRLGLWGFDLSAQTLVQESVEAEQRGSFSTAEAALQNAFELAAFASTAIWSRPEDFRYPVLVSVGAVAASGVLYAAYVRRRRGHLLHLPCGAGSWSKSDRDGVAEAATAAAATATAAALERAGDQGNDEDANDDGTYDNGTNQCGTEGSHGETSRSGCGSGTA